MEIKMEIKKEIKKDTKHCIYDKGLVCGVPKELCFACSEVMVREIAIYGPYKSP